MMIQNESFNKDLVQSDDLFVCCIGYEQRSPYLLNQVSKDIPMGNMLIFVFDELLSNTNRRIAEEFKSACKSATYESASEAQQYIVQFYEDRVQCASSVTLHIDYSSMPRSWYCKLPAMLTSLMRKEDKINFWYVVGEYPDDYTTYPSAGIKSFTLFSGKPSLRTDKKRMHIICLSYDTIRTQAIISMLDPDAYIACDAFDSQHREIHDHVVEINAETISHATMSTSLHTDDFSFMVAKLCEIANDFSMRGDVIIVPDGPKPLIFAASLVPDFTGQNGVTCLHIARNIQHFTPPDVIPTDRIIGFSIAPSII